MATAQDASSLVAHQVIGEEEDFVFVDAIEEVDPSQSVSRPSDWPTLPTVWDHNWASLPNITSTALIVGEWGGLWNATSFRGFPFRYRMILFSLIIEPSVGFCSSRLQVFSGYWPSARSSASH